MKEIVLVITTALISGLLATIVTILFQKKTEIHNKKLKIFEILMYGRYCISSEDNVKALNSIDVVFYNDTNVRKAYKNFLDETEKKLEQNPNIEDKHLILLEKISKVLKLKDIRWDEIKRYYYPSGLSEKIEEEITLRKVQLQNAFEKIEINNAQQSVNSNNEFSQELITEMIKNPESLNGFLELTKMFGTFEKKE